MASAQISWTMNQLFNELPNKLDTSDMKACPYYYRNDNFRRQKLYSSPHMGSRLYIQQDVLLQSCGCGIRRKREIRHQPLFLLTPMSRWVRCRGALWLRELMVWVRGYKKWRRFFHPLEFWWMVWWAEGIVLLLDLNACSFTKYGGTVGWRWGLRGVVFEICTSSSPLFWTDCAPPPPQFILLLLLLLFKKISGQILQNCLQWRDGQQPVLPRLLDRK